MKRLSKNGTIHKSNQGDQTSLYPAATDVVVWITTRNGQITFMMIDIWYYARVLTESRPRMKRLGINLSVY